MNASTTTQISRLQKMSLEELREQYQEVFGKPTKSRNRKQLFSQIARKIQEGETGTESASVPKPTLTAKFEPKRKRSQKGAKAGKGKDQKRQPAKTGKPKPIGARDPRLPKVGTTITKKYKGKTINVRVLEQGFEYQGKPFRSLSAVAKHVTGSIWNGFLFFGLNERVRRTPDSCGESKKS